MRRADVILVTKSPDDISPIQRRLIVKEIDKAPYQNLYFTSILYKSPQPVFELNKTGVIPDINNLYGKGVVLVTGIANPLPLKKLIDTTAGEVIHLQFPDHYRFQQKDIQAITEAFDRLKAPSRLILTTEKDSVRLKEFTNIAEPVMKSMFYIPVGIDFLNEDRDEFDKLIIEYVRKDKRNNRLSEI
jgi:tetraacyldisaccharide 4'-kinase